MSPTLILTIGHSNRPLQEFLALLETHGVELLVDVRTVPKSRFNPQFNKDALPHSLDAVHVEYSHMPGLGGLRHPRPDSINTGWRNDSFRGYADYMQTAEFQHNLNQLRELAERQRTVIMCAESVPWRCHRSLIADALSVQGDEVQHILGKGPPRPDQLTAFAAVNGKQVTYPPDSLRLFTE